MLVAAAAGAAVLWRGFGAGEAETAYRTAPAQRADLVVTGQSDGSLTEIVEGDLRAGEPVILGAGG